MSAPACAGGPRGFVSACSCIPSNFDESCESTSQKAEAFLERAVSAPAYAGGPFDFISVCPPYLLVSYPQLFQLLEVGR